MLCGQQDLQLAAEMGCMVNIDSMFDCKHIVSASGAAMAKGATRTRVLLRVNPDINPDSKVTSAWTTLCCVAIDRMGCLVCGLRCTRITARATPALSSELTSPTWTKWSKLFKDANL